MSNTPPLFFATSCARSITVNVSADTTTGFLPAFALIFDVSDVSVHVVISASRRFISLNTASAALAASASLSVQNQTDTNVPIALSRYSILAGAAAATDEVSNKTAIAARITLPSARRAE